MAGDAKRFKLERRLNFGAAHEAQSRGALGRVLAEPDWRSIPDQVRDAQDLGFDVLLSAEVPGDPYLPLVLASQVPGRITLATGIAIALARSPVSTAYTAWELQRMSGGRFVLGLGSQVRAHVVRRFAMPWSAPAQRMREYVQVVRACWRTWQTGEPLAYRGEVYQVDLMPPVMHLPPQAHPDIPIQLAAVGEHMLRTAGEVCDGVRLHDFCTRRYIDEVALPNLRKGFERSGRPEAAWRAFEMTGGGMIVTAATEDALRHEMLDLRRRLAFYGSTPAYRAAMDIEGFGEQAERLTALSKLGRWDEMAQVFTDEMASRFAAIGTHDVIAARVRERFAGMSAIHLPMPVRDDAEREVAREIVRAIGS